MSGVYIQDGEPRLTDCKISGHAKVGVVSDKGGGNVIRRKIHYNKAFGIQAGARLSVRDCELNDNVEDGVYVHEGGDISLERCELARSGDCNVRLHEGHARLVGCTIHHAKSPGVFAEGECTVDLDACDVFENGEFGLYVMDQTKATVKRSHFHANVDGNVLVRNDASAAFSDSATDELQVDDSGRVSLKKTLVRKDIKKSKTAKVTEKDRVTGADRPFKLPAMNKPPEADEAELEYERRVAVVIRVDLRADAMTLARSLADRSNLAVLASAGSTADARSSFIACDPVESSDALVPDAGPTTHGWAGLPSAPRWIGVIPYEHLRGLERHLLTWSETREAPMITEPKWLRYAAILRIDHATGAVVIEADDVEAAHRLLALARRAPLAPKPVSLTPREDGEDGHADRIRRVLDFIARGDAYQVNLARRLAFDFEGAPLDLFASMRRRSPSPWSVYLDMGEVQIAGTSPELALSVRGSRLRTVPIKGTRPRGEDWTTDLAIKNDLDRDPKERSELVMAIDLHRNDLGRVAKTGTVRVLGEPTITSGVTVHSRAAQIVAERALGLDLLEIARAFLPAGSVTGAPKVRAMEIIAELEPHRRGLYTGAIGYVGRDGSLELAMAIRTATIRDHVAHYFTGGGIVWGSDPEREVQETNWKALQLGADGTAQKLPE